MHGFGGQRQHQRGADARQAGGQQQGAPAGGGFVGVVVVVVVVMIVLVAVTVVIVLVVVRRQLHRAAGSRIARWAFGCRGLGRARHLGRKACCAQALGHVGQRAGRGVHAQLARAEAKRQPLHAGHVAQGVANLAFFGGAIHVGDAPGDAFSRHAKIKNPGSTPTSRGFATSP